jgi:ERCC4-type nuclease
VIRDTREQKGKGWNFRASANCEGMESIKLDVGDYTVKGMEEVLAIERKTIGDLWNTLGAAKNYNRFKREWERGKDYKYKFLIIEGSLADIDKGYRWSKVPVANIHAKLISLQINYNVHVVFAGRLDCARKYTRRLMAKIFTHHQEGKA